VYKKPRLKRVSALSECVRKVVEEIARRTVPTSPIVQGLDPCSDLPLAGDRVAIALRSFPSPGSVILETMIMRGCSFFPGASHAVDARVEARL
jgi:hypothetical protein